MELKYLVARYQRKRSIFIVLPREVELLHERLWKAGFHSFIEGAFNEDELSRKKLDRWINKVERCVVTGQLIDSEMLSGMICQAHLSGIPVVDLEAFLIEIDPMVPANANQLIHLLATCGVHQDRALKFYTWVKYTIEPHVALLLLILLSPLMLLVAVLVKITSPGPVIYEQERVGFRNRVFKIYKFRSMKTDAERDGPAWASASRHDPALTPIGGFLRASHLDELPQLFNVIRGDVSFIGPRPERPEFVKQLVEKYPLFKLRPLLKPGITGWAQVQQGYANSNEDSLHKLELDLFYLIKHSIRLDLKILFRTFLVIFTGGTERIKRSRTYRFSQAIQKKVRVLS